MNPSAFMMIGAIATSVLEAVGVWSHREHLGISPTPASAGVASHREQGSFDGIMGTWTIKVSTTSKVQVIIHPSA